MADFAIPFGTNGEKRQPTTVEKDVGFLCGPADQPLFTGLIHDLQSEVGNVIAEAGLTPSSNNLAQLKEAILALIAAAVPAEEDLSTLLSLAQARARLPIYPDVQTLTGKMTVVSPGTGIVRLGGGVTFTHRGIFNITTDQVDFNTDASKTYHLRWNPTDGFTLKDLASGIYNPGAVAETDVKFDSTFDDMLVARVITNSSNVVTPTPLVNKDRWRFDGYLVMGAAAQGTPTPQASEVINFARRPIASLVMVGAIADNYQTAGGLTDEVTYGVRALTRYQVDGFYLRYGLLGEGAALTYVASM